MSAVLANAKTAVFFRLLGFLLIHVRTDHVDIAIDTEESGTEKKELSDKDDDRMVNDSSGRQQQCHDRQDHCYDPRGKCELLFHGRWDGVKV